MNLPPTSVPQKHTNLNRVERLCRWSSFGCHPHYNSLVETMDQGQGAEEDQEQDAAAKYFQFAEQFLALSDDEMDDTTEAAAAASFLDLMGIAASMEEDAEMSEEGEETPAVWGGSRPGKAPNKNRDFMGAHAKLVEHYFSGEESLYNETDFEQRF
jgi:hypothetical protein